MRPPGRLPFVEWKERLAPTIGTKDTMIFHDVFSTNDLMCELTNNYEITNYENNNLAI